MWSTIMGSIPKMANWNCSWVIKVVKGCIPVSKKKETLVEGRNKSHLWAIQEDHQTSKHVKSNLRAHDFLTTKRELDRCARTAARSRRWLTSSVVGESQSLRVSASASNLDNSLTHQSFDLLRPQLCDVVAVAETSVFTYGNKKLGYVSSPKSGRPCGAMKMAKSCKEGTAATQRRSGSEGCKIKTASNDFSKWNVH